MDFDPRLAANCTSFSGILETRGCPFINLPETVATVDTRGNKYWPHASFAQELFDWGALSDAELLDDFEFLRGRRIQADYYPDPVIEEQAQEAVEIASKLVKQLLGS